MTSDTDAIRGAIARAERAVGVPATAVFVAMLALGRSGWREQDFRAVGPGLSGQPWEPSDFAALCESLAGHLIRLAPHSQLDVRSDAERLACRQYVLDAALDPPKVHLAIALHLLALSPADPLRVTETMHHLLKAQAWSRAAGYLADLDPDGAGAKAARQVMSALVRASSAENPTSGAAVLTRLLRAESIAATARLSVASHLLHVHYGTQGRCSLESEATLLDAVEDVVGQILREQPDDADAVDVYARCLTWRGHLRSDQGDLRASVADLRRADAMRQQAQSVDSPATELLETPPSLAIGDALLAQGDLDGAMAVYEHPGNAESPIGQQRIGHVLRGRGDFGAAILHYQRGLDGLKRLLQARPDDESTLVNIAIGWSSIATAHLMMGDPRKSAELYREGELVLAGVAARNPAEPHVHSEWALMLYRKGHALQACADLDGARRSYEQAVSVLKAVIQRHPDNPHYRYRRAMFGLGRGELQMQTDDVHGARQRWNESLREIAALIAGCGNSQEWLALARALEARIATTSLQRRVARFVDSGLARLRRAPR